MRKIALLSLTFALIASIILPQVQAQTLQDMANQAAAQLSPSELEEIRALEAEIATLRELRNEDAVDSLSFASGTVVFGVMSYALIRNLRKIRPREMMALPFVAVAAGASAAMFEFNTEEWQRLNKALDLLSAKLEKRKAVLGAK
ncbi:MAG TPA: hypothetical protein PKC28_12565 [Bdellovibrionales bacterium]|nr:hypothetical protein [Bdellovibrionales bacterium]